MSNIYDSILLHYEIKDKYDEQWKKTIHLIPRVELNEFNVGLLWQSYTIAKNLHKNQTRDSGDLYITHPLAVAEILASVGATPTQIAAGFMHDIVEDCKYPLNRIENVFGPDICKIINALSKTVLKDDTDLTEGKEWIEKATFDKLIVEKDAYVIKLADRLHNLRTIEYKKNEVSRRKKIAHTEQVLIPMAKKMEAYYFYNELLNQCFRFNEPIKFYFIEQQYNNIINFNKIALTSIMSIIKQLEKADYTFKIKYFRPLPEELYKLLNSSTGIKIIKKEQIFLYKIFIIYANSRHDHSYISFIDFFKNVLRVKKWRMNLHTYGDIPSFELIDPFLNRFLCYFVSNEQFSRYTLGCPEEVHIESMDEVEKEQIKVYINDKESFKYIEKGATILDFALKVDKALGVCAKSARINGSTGEYPLNHRLKNNDVVEIMYAFDENNIRKIQVNIKSFSYINTKSSCNTLIDYFSNHQELCFK